LTSLFVVALAAESRAVLVFDNYDLFSSSGTFVGADDWQGGDRVVLPSPGAGNMWVIDSFTGRVGGSATGSYSNVQATLTVFKTVVLTGTGPAFADPLGSATRSISPFFASAPGIGPDFTMSALGIALNSAPSDPGVGYGVRIAFSASGPGVVVPHYRDQQSTVAGSSSSQGWYRDLNDDGTLTANEYEVFAPWADANLMFEMDATATPVPEPATLVALLVPVALVLRRRRR
jgi:hypothetical protein